MILNLEVRKYGDGYQLFEQAGSNPRAEAPVFEGSRAEVESWLADRGAAHADVARALDLAGGEDGALLEVDLDYTEAENFPKL